MDVNSPGGQDTVTLRRFHVQMEGSMGHRVWTVNVAGQRHGDHESGGVIGEPKASWGEEFGLSKVNLTPAR